MNKGGLINKQNIILAAVAMFFLVASGCGEKEEAESSRSAVSAEAGSVTGDEYVEYVARVYLVQQKYQQQYQEAVQSEDEEQLAQIQQQFAEEAENTVSELGLSMEAIQEFESRNEEFLSDPEVQQQVMDRMEELTQ